MPTVKPFSGLRYNPEKISFISRVVTPPYDVIDPAAEQHLIEKDPHNFIRLGMGKTPQESRPDEEYLFIADIIDKWQEQEVLIRDEKPCMYVMEQTFNINGKRYSRRGFTAALLLEELGSGSIHPHENIMKGPKADRMKLMDACKTNLSQPIMMHSDPDAAVSRMLKTFCSNPDFLYSFRGQRGVGHTIWKIDDEDFIQKATELMASRSAVIADGHHRYESAYAYCHDNRPQGTPFGQANEDYISAFLISVEDEGLISLPTHRGVKPDIDREMEIILNDLRQDCDMESVAVTDGDRVYGHFSKAADNKNSLGCITQDNHLDILTPKNTDDWQMSDENMHPELCNLPVGLLHGSIFPKHFGIHPGTDVEANSVDYVSSASEIFWGVQSGKYDAGFLLPSISPGIIQKLAQNGIRMPIKSTFFYPKIPSGIVMYPHN